MSRAVGATDLRETAAAQAASIDRILEWVVLAVLVITVFIYVWVLFLAGGWVERPFIGAFVEQTFLFNGIGDPTDPAWSARGIVPEGDQLVAVDGVPVTTSAGLGAELARREVGQTVVLSTRSRDGLPRTYTVTLSDFPLPDFVRFFAIPYFIGLIYLVIGWWVFRLRRGEPTGRAFALTCALTAIAVGALFDLYTTHVFTWAWTIAVPNVGAATLALALVFPQTAGPVLRRPLVRLSSFIPGLLLAAYALYTLYWPGVDPYAYVVAWRIGYYYLGVGMAFLLGMMLYRWRSNTSPLVGAQSRIIFFGAVAGFAPLLIWVVEALVMGLTPTFNVLLNLGPLVLFPTAVAYAILRYRLLYTDVVVGQAMVYAIIGVITLAGYGLIITGLSWIAGTYIGADDPVAISLIVFLLVAAFQPLHERTRRLVNQAFFRG